MFRTVRHWWSEGSGQNTARLFVFEFVVVVAGVLVAQGLAKWVQEQADHSEGRQLVAVAQLFVRSSNEPITGFGTPTAFVAMSTTFLAPPRPDGR